MNAPILPPRGFRASRRPRLPPPIRSLVRNLPRVPSSAVVATMLNLTVRRRLSQEVLAALACDSFTVEVRDLDLTMAFRYVRRRFVPVPAMGVPALRFRVNAADFAALAAGEGDPQAAFLCDLVVVGDPQVAAEVRATLQGLDVERTRRALQRAARRAERELGTG
jgi:predicted lipid carrier protein YhbT